MQNLTDSKLRLQLTLVENEGCRLDVLKESSPGLWQLIQFPKEILVSSQNPIQPEILINFFKFLLGERHFTLTKNPPYENCNHWSLEFWDPLHIHLPPKFRWWVLVDKFCKLSTQYNPPIKGVIRFNDCSPQEQFNEVVILAKLLGLLTGRSVEGSEEPNELGSYTFYYSMP